MALELAQQRRTKMSWNESSESWRPRRRNMIKQKCWRGGQLGNLYVFHHCKVIPKLTNKTSAEKGILNYETSRAR